jgi:DNA-binding XRE family transcriptional regulator
MSEPMKKRSTDNDIVVKDEGGRIYILPKSVAKKYQKINDAILPENFFASYEEEYTKPGLILRGVRFREGLTQEAFAKRINVSQANLSKMELGHRPIGKEMAKRIANEFDINYRSLL